ncbi:MAG: AtpZ/AtpI family protein [Myxococcaceae bacterium]|nr:AtpZ/AtpI family protein [Myxococcaceae bacterium]
MSGPDNQASAVAKAYRAAAPWLSATWQFVGAALVGVLAGWGVDRWVESKAGYGLVVGGLLGSVLGCVSFIRTALKLLDSKGKP